MKNKIFTIALTLMGSSFLFAQQWTGANNTTSNISRTGNVSIGTSNTTDKLNLNGSFGIAASYGSEFNPPIKKVIFYDSNSNPVHFIGTRTNTIGSGLSNPSISYLANSLYIGSASHENTLVITDGKISIGTNVSFHSDGYRLYVKDGIRTEKIKVDIAANNGWADYVFEPDYNLMPLAEVEQFIKQNGHLPEVPTTEQAIANGIELKEMNILLLKKVEELTLYSIQQQKELEELKAQVGDLLKSKK
ncbi:hypothetical protein SAMN05421741_11111 [Paenimyroides ummariense]|uniref:BZIP transcription factor n=1 Tax=Paenimyroides ummariense TaxID=913024 RepID=A0A1I5BY14_9FLAO|nr:hypothetical protein [Paenimyroides ummariense]SFN79502.1 hypothetical protein SAMN05421741_11111 [Paenimyroides ummariense]